MLRIISAFLLVFLFAQSAQAEGVQFFPPQGPCNAENPILAWNGNGTTYCTHFPTAVLPDCGDGEYLTKKNGNLVSAKLTTGAVSSSTPATPTAPTTTTPTTTTSTTPTPAYNSNGTPTGAPLSTAATSGSTYPNPVQRTGNNACPDITIPTCASDSVLVNYGLDYNGCQTSPQCKYMGSTAAATAVKASYANGGLSNSSVASSNGTSTPSYANGGISNSSVASSNGYGYYNPYASSSYYTTPYYSTPTYVDEYYVEPVYYEPAYYEPSYSEPSYSEPSYAYEE